MPEPKLRTVTRTQGNNRALKDGTVKPMTAVAVFLVRAFHHGAVLVNTKAGIRTPKDLEGRKVGVNRGYTVTTGVWARSILQEEYGVDLGKITWVLSGDEHVAEYDPHATVVPIDRK